MFEPLLELDVKTVVMSADRRIVQKTIVSCAATAVP
jgi:hypothetical protein